MRSFPRIVYVGQKIFLLLPGRLTERKEPIKNGHGVGLVEPRVLKKLNDVDGTPQLYFPCSGHIYYHHFSRPQPPQRVSLSIKHIVI